MKTLLTFFFCLALSFAKAQFVDKLTKKAQKSVERTIERKVEQKASKTASDGMDKVLNTKNKTTNTNNESTKSNNPKSKISKNESDFVAGNKLLFEENFKSDAKGDFPVNWFTNSSGEIITFDGDAKKWLQISDKGSFSPINISKLPENFTFEFDIITTDNFNFYSTPLNIVFTEKKTKSDNVWNTVFKRNEAVIFNLHPANSLSGAGRSEVFVISEKKEIIKNKVDVPIFNKNNNLVKVQIWRQKNRFRMYVDGKKFWDLPTAFSETNYNQIIFFIGTYKNTIDKFFISNLRLAEAGSDKRHLLIETGSFTTNEILFDTNNATIKLSSEKVLDELGIALKDNPLVRVTITGHTDNDGSDNDNQKLSKKRAEAVADFLAANYGILKTRFETNGKGESEPITNNTSKDGKMQNRRVEFKIIN